MTESADQAEKLISLCALGFAIELVLFKFLPDVSTAVIQHSTSTLGDFGRFEQEYLRAGSVHHARFLGNQILYRLARLIGTAYHGTDSRLHPLRIAAGILTPVYCYIGAWLPLSRRSPLAWRHFIAPYGLLVLMGLYVFYPADMPGLAFLSLSLFFLLQQRLGPALLLMLITGLFRETSFHCLWFVAVWAWCDREPPLRRRMLWLAAFAGAFVFEYLLIRRFFPGPVSSAGGLITEPRALFLDRGMLSLTTLCSLGLAALFPLACLVRLRAMAAGDWRRTFFAINCYVFPGWVIFYRMMNGNLSEFRMLFPVLLPCIYGIASAAGRRGSTQADSPQLGT